MKAQMKKLRKLRKIEVLKKKLIEKVKVLIWVKK